MSEISRIARESELRRRVRNDRVRQAAIRAGQRLPPVLADFLKMLAASVVGFWILTELLALVSPAKPLYTLSAFALLFSAQATFYKLKLASDPDFEIRGCGCGGRKDDTATVLRSRESAILGVPNSALGVVLYATLLAAVAVDNRNAAVALAVAAVLASAYLGYVMVVRLASLCPTCVNVAALNVLILVQLVR